MKKSALTILVFLAMTSVTFGVSLDLFDNGPVVGFATLHSYTLRATGTGIQTLSQFTIDNLVEQFIPDSDWAGSLDYPVGDVNDSYVIFGDLRIPDLASASQTAGTHYTEETLPFGQGTLNNYDDPDTIPDNGDENWDVYLEFDAPSPGDVPHDLIHLVIAGHDPTIINLNVRILTATDQQPDLSWTTTTYDLAMVDGVFVTAVPENGDTDDDGDIDFDDWVNFSAGWFGPDGADPVNGTPNASWLYGDNDDDGNVDFDDFVAFSGSGGLGGDGWFGPNGLGYVPPVGAVPEPSTIVMLILGALCLVGYRARK